MNLSENTVNILKNFATISGNLLIQPGNELKTISATNSLFASATVDEMFPTEFGIYDLNEFLAVLSLFGKPELEFGDKCVTVSEGSSKIRYFKAESSLLAYPKREIKFPGSVVDFEIKADVLGVILKTAATLKAPDVTFSSVEGYVMLTVGNKKNPTGNTFNTPLAPWTGAAFKANILANNLKMIGTTYNVSLSSKRAARLTSTDGKLQYFVAMEADSEFGE